MDRFLWDMTHECTVDEEPRMRTTWTGSNKVLDRLAFESYYFSSLRELNNCGTFFNETHGGDGISKSPFIDGTLYVEQGLRDFPPLPGMLTKFGVHLVHFGLSTGMAKSLLEFTKQLGDCLEVLPNLKFLEVFGLVCWLPSFNRSPNQEELVNQIDRLKRLPRLKFLSSDELEDESSSLLIRLVTLHAEQLSRLHIRINKVVRLRRGFPTDFPSLKELHIAVESLKLTETFVNGLLECRHPPRLIKMGFTLCSSEHITLSRKGAIDKYFRLFNLFGLTLQTIRIAADDDFDEDTSEEHFIVQTRIICPVLRFVEISGFSRLSLNFLRNFALTVEDISIGISNEDNPRSSAYREELVDFYDHVKTSKMYDCNMWEILPRLQFFDFEYENLGKQVKTKGRFTRKTYQRLKTARCPQ